jgi:hypothetical protein
MTRSLALRAEGLDDLIIQVEIVSLQVVILCTNGKIRYIMVLMMYQGKYEARRK